VLDPISLREIAKHARFCTSAHSGTGAKAVQQEAEIIEHDESVETLCQSVVVHHHQLNVIVSDFRKPSEESAADQTRPR
jgi:hypothetical protein